MGYNPRPAVSIARISTLALLIVSSYSAEGGESAGRRTRMAWAVGVVCRRVGAWRDGTGRLDVAGLPVGRDAGRRAGGRRRRAGVSYAGRRTTTAGRHGATSTRAGSSTTTFV